MDKIRLSEQALLIKCLNCRLIQRPPAFNLPPPPMPPIELLEELSLPTSLFSSSTTTSTSSLSLKKRCLRVGNLLNRLWTSKQTLSSAALAAAATSVKRLNKLDAEGLHEQSLEIDASLLTTSANINNRFQSGSSHYVLMFLISFVVFLFLFIILCLFVFKLFR
jgi:hypothetical protein